jgi:hypothetical protein
MQREELVLAQQAGLREELSLLAKDRDHLRRLSAEEPAVGGVVLDRINVMPRAHDLRWRVVTVARERARPVILRTMTMVDVDAPVAQQRAEPRHVFEECQRAEALLEAAAGEGLEPGLGGAFGQFAFCRRDHDDVVPDGLKRFA